MAHKQIHKKETDHSHKSGFPKDLQDTDAKQLKELHARHFKDYATLRQKPANYRKALYSYFKAAGNANISIEDAHNFHKKAVYEDASKLRSGCQGGQHPGAIVFSNSSEDYSHSIFSFGARTDSSNVLVGGSFGGAINIRKEKHLAQTSDFIASAYMNGHMVDKGTPVAYEIFNVTVRSNERGTDAEKEAIALGVKRRDKFVQEWRAAGFEIEDSGKGMTPSRLSFTNNEVVRIPLPVVVHDLGECRFYVVEKDRKIPFEKWANDNKLDGNPIVERHLMSMKDHKSEAGHFEELVRMTMTRKGIYCVDSRHLRQNGSVIKDLGAIASEDQRERILETPGIKNVTVCLHFNCGYLQTAMIVHETGAEINQALKNGIAKGMGHEAEAVRSSLKRKIEEIAEGKWTGFDLNVFATRLEELGGKSLSKKSLHFLKELLTSQFSDTRNTAQHMVARNMLAWDEKLGTVVMPAAAELDRTLPKKSLALPQNRNLDDKNSLMQKEYYYRVTIIEAHRQKNAWEATKQSMENAGRLKNHLAINVHIENFTNGKVVATTDGKAVYDPIAAKKEI